jgi:NADH:ubiquinone oxidoreductase subunit 5 (subunit L)/multisubunit Na+/H+ antiporter MnhA subunit
MSRIQRFFQLVLFMALVLFAFHVLKTTGFVSREGFYQAATEEGMPGWAIALIVIGVVGAVGGIVYWFWKSRAPTYNNRGSYNNGSGAY